MNPVFDVIHNLIDDLKNTQMEVIEEAAVACADAIESGAILQAYGSGHSEAGAMEVAHRAGGFIPTKKIIEPARGAYEGIENVGNTFMKKVDIRKGDVVFIISNSGRNPVPIEMAMGAKKKGAKVIAMTNMNHSQSCESRHSSGKKMYELADVTIDNCGDIGDASFPIDGLDTCIGPTSDAVGITIAQALVCEVVDKLVKEGIEPPIFKSSNVDGGDEHNHAMFEKYYGYWK